MGVHKKTGENIFAVQSEFEYQLLPVSHLFADKFTTIGCNTIGCRTIGWMNRSNRSNSFMMS